MHNPRSSFILLLLALLALLTSHHQTAAQTIYKCVVLKQHFPRCNCSGTVHEPVLDCSGLDLVAVPDMSNVTFNDKIAQFRLNNNRITTLDANAFNGLKVVSLDLGGNNISSVANDTFNGLLTHLTTLVLQGDGQVNPPKAAFHNIQNLKYLTLKNYGPRTIDNLPEHYYVNSFTHLKEITIDGWPNLYHIEAEAFNGPDHLKKVSLINLVKLTNFPLDLLNFRDMKSIETLAIKNTKINKSLSSKMFQNLDNIKEIDISYNAIPSIHNEAFYGVGDTLEKLDISHNLLQAVTTQQGTTKPKIHDIPSLLVLDLSNNKDLMVMPVLQNVGNSKGLALSLKNCSIPLIEETDLRQTRGLTSLDLSDNKISTIHKDSFIGATQLKVLRLDRQIDTSNTNLIFPESLLNASGTMEELHLSGGMLLDSASLWTVVSNLPELKVLNLASAELTEKNIPDFGLRELTKLEELNLDFMSTMSSLTDKSLVGPRRSLRSLTLKSIPLTTLSHCLLYQYETMVDINFSETFFTCDCKVEWIKTAYDRKTISFNQTGSKPKCGTNSADLLTFNFDSCQTQVPCDDYYTTITTAAPTITPSHNNPSPDINAAVVSTTSFEVSWNILPTEKLQNFAVRVREEVSDELVFEELQISKNDRRIRVTSPKIKPATTYSCCVSAIYSNTDPTKDCHTLTTQSGTTPTSDPPDADSQTDDGDTAVVIGGIVGGVVLLVLILAIIYLVFIRRRAPKKPEPRTEQPRTFTKAELPSMMPMETRTFTKPKRQQPTDGNDTAMQVVAISDGQTGAGRIGGYHVGRADKLMPNDGYKDMSGMKPLRKKADVEKSFYENDHGPLPDTPRISTGSAPPQYKDSVSYTNNGFQVDKYDEIPLDRDSVVL